MDMVGKVRAALFAALCTGESGLGGAGTAYVLDVSSDGDDEVVVDGYIDLAALARAAIAAMREPSEEMLDVLHGEIEIDVNTLESRASKRSRRHSGAD